MIRILSDTCEGETQYVSSLLRLVQSTNTLMQALLEHIDVIFKAPRIHDAQKEYRRGALGVGCGADLC